MAAVGGVFGDLAGGWMPFNLATTHAQKGCLTGTFPPGHRDPREFAAVLATVHTCDFEAALRLRSTGKPICSNEAVLPLYPPDGQPGPVGYVPWPDGLADVLARLHRELPDARFVVAEIGYGDTGGLDDTGRCEYLLRAFEHLAAAQANGMRIEGVSIWAGIDNSEWLAGHSVSFGLFDADRRPRRSAELIRTLTRG